MSEPPSPSPSSAAPGAASSPAPSPAPMWSPRGLPELALLALTALALVLCFLVARPFVGALAWAMALAVVGWPLHRRIAQRLRRPGIAAAVSVTVVAVLVVVPAVLLVPAAVDEAMAGYRSVRERIESGAWNEALARQAWLGPAWEWVRQRIALTDVLQQAGTMLTAIGSFAVRSSFVGAIELALTIFFLFYFLRDRDALLASLRRLLPLSPEESTRLFGLAGETLFATLYGKVLVALVQGLLGGLMFWWLGLPAAWFWAIVMGVLSILPLLGPPLVWGPAALLMMLDGQWGQALLMLAWGAAVVGLADNVLYPMVVGRHLQLHTVPLLVAMIGGVIVFGAVGFFLGPVVLALTMGLLEIWRARAGGAAAPA